MDLRFEFKADILYSPSQVKVCCKWHEKQSQRTPSPVKDYRNSSKDYKMSYSCTLVSIFRKALDLILPPPPLLFLSKTDQKPRGIIQEGVKEKSCYFIHPPHPFIFYPSLYGLLFVEGLSHCLKTSNAILYFYLSFIQTYF